MKQLLLFLFLTAFGAAGFSQVQRTAPKQDSALTAGSSSESKVSQRKKMRELNLDKTQKQELKALKQKNKAAIEAVQNDESLSADQKAQKLRELKTGQAKAVGAVLSPEQKSKMKEMRQKKQAEQRNSQK